MKDFSTAIGLFIGLLVFLFLCWAIGYAFSWWAAPWQGKLQARQEIQSGSSRIANYNHFFNLCASVQSSEARIDELSLLPEPTTQFDRERQATNVAAAKIIRAEAINQYNADARKDYTQGQFRDSDLPYQISTSDYKKGDRRTSCGSE